MLRALSRSMATLLSLPLSVSLVFVSFKLTGNELQSSSLNDSVLPGHYLQVARTRTGPMTCLVGKAGCSDRLLLASVPACHSPVRKRGRRALSLFPTDGAARLPSHRFPVGPARVCTSQDVHFEILTSCLQRLPISLPYMG